MSERPPEQRALFDRVVALLDASKAKTPGTIEEVAQLSDLDAALSLCAHLCADLDEIIRGARVRHRCGHCIRAGVEKWEDAKTYTDDEVTAHVAQCPHNPLVCAVWTALNALDACSAARVLGYVPDEFVGAESYALEVLRRMVGR